MKNYEQMSRDVLKRRDEELQKNNTYKSRFLKIAVPCCSVLAVIMIGSLVWTKSRTVVSEKNTIDKDLGDSGNQLQVYKYSVDGHAESMAPTSAPEPDVSSAAEAAPLTPEPELGIEENANDTGADIVSSAAVAVDTTGFDGADYDIAFEEPPVEPDKPENLESDNIIINLIERFYLPEVRDVSGWDYDPMTVDELSLFYRVPLNALSLAHPGWQEKHGDLGYYSRTTDDGVVVTYEMEDIGTLYYTTPDNARITVIPSLGTPQNPDKPPETDKRNHSDNTISLPDGGMATPSYSPPIDTVEVGEEQLADLSLIDSIPVTIYRNADGDYLADFQPSGSDYGYLRVIAENMPEDNFINVIKTFITTNVSYNTQEPVEIPLPIPEGDITEPLEAPEPNGGYAEQPINTDDIYPKDSLLDDELDESSIVD